MQLTTKPAPSPWAMMSPEEQGMFAQQLNMGAMPQSLLAQADTAAPVEEVEMPAQPIRAAKPNVSHETSTMSQMSAPAPMQQSDYDMLIERLNAKGMDSLKLQGEGIAKQEEMINQFRQKEPETDLTAIAGLLDQWSPGANHLATTKRPMSREEREMLAQKLDMELQRSREGMSENEINLLKSQLGIAAQREESQARLENQKQGREALALQRAQLKDSKDERETQRQREAFAKSDDTKVLHGTTAFTAALNKYEHAVKKYGVTPVGEGAAKLKNAYSDLQVAFKEIEKLGALAGPDLGILTDQVSDAGGFKQYFNAQSRGGKQGILAQIADAKTKANKRYGEYTDYLKGTYPMIADEQLKPYEQHFKAASEPVGKKKTQTASNTNSSGLPVGKTVRNKTNGKLYKVGQDGNLIPI